jgi:acetylornithine deacetylase/succinyl-diaminopimelate desuccinylase-like protein
MIDEAERARKKRRHRHERIAATLLVLTAAVGVWAFLRWNEGDEEAFQRQRTYIPPRVEITPEVALLQQYVRIDTRAGREIEGARWLAGVLKGAGIAAEIIESGPGRGNVYARLKGRQPGGGLMLAHHIDVYAIGEKPWDEPPFAANVRQAMVHGRGVLDMKAVGIAHLLAFIDVARSGRQPERDLVFLASADEEQGSALGMQWLIANRPDIFEGIEYALSEGGLNESTAEKMQYFGIEIGGKHFAELTLEAALPDQLAQARLAVEPYFPSMDPDEVRPDVVRFFRDIAPTRRQYRELLEDLNATVERGRFWRLPDSYRQFSQDVLLMEAPESANGRHTARVVLANIPGHDLLPTIRQLAEVVKPYGVTIASIEHRDPVVEPSPADTPLFRLLAEAASKEYGCASGTLMLHRSTTDSRFLRQIGIRAYGFLPFAVDYFQSMSIHEANERIRVDWFQRGVALTRRVVARQAFGTQ